MGTVDSPLYSSIVAQIDKKRIWGYSSRQLIAKIYNGNVQKNNRDRRNG
ncbi:MULTISPECIES: hypothetical protein [unclassified Roseofilum]|nr:MULTISPECIES: hypothetical protein [unclassified Roseofilum]MBP0010961.1 hypothetical protein [Roseofilum sp. Belize Diploria]MBP0035368.1 hypothetical protein [Roseofilum sp. Belize BBD 4]